MPKADILYHSHETLKHQTLHPPLHFFMGFSFLGSTPVDYFFPTQLWGGDSPSWGDGNRSNPQPIPSKKRLPARFNSCSPLKIGRQKPPNGNRISLPGIIFSRAFAVKLRWCRCWFETKKPSVYRVCLQKPQSLLVGYIPTHFPLNQISGRGQNFWPEDSWTNFRSSHLGQSLL